MIFNKILRYLSKSVGFSVFCEIQDNEMHRDNKILPLVWQITIIKDV